VNFEQVKPHLEGGGLIAYPTETVWGLGALYDNEKALENLIDLKGRELTKGISLLVSDFYMAQDVALIDDERVKNFLRIAWPGPLTAVLPVRSVISSLIHGGTGYVGLRLSTHPVVTRLLALTQKPLTTTSANKSGVPPALSVGDLYWLPPEVGVLSESNLEAGGQSPSTVVRFQNDGIKILRSGAISDDELLRLAHLCDLALI
jgi:L-threonylcarbamoyladenylate synthase